MRVASTIEACTLCGERATARWDGDHGAIATCERCALDVLPAIISDSVGLSIDPTRTHDIVQGHLDHVAQVYWRAMAMRLLRERTEDRPT